jgi:acetyl esterase
MRRSFIVGITGVMAYVILVAGLIVFPAGNNIINNLIFDRSNQIAHATTASTYNYTGIGPTTRAFLEKTDAGPPIYTLTPQKARALLNGLQASYPVQKLPADIENRTIPGGPNGTKVSITIVRPPNSSNETLPVVIYTHGGGWVLGGFNTHDRLVREIANKAHVAIVFVNYTPSPEAKYPFSLEQAYAATKWVAQNGQTIHVNPSRLAIVGDSVGGNMAAALAILAKERGGPKITFQVLFYPVTDGTNFNSSSYIKLQNGYWLTRQAMKWFWDNYAPDKAIRKQPTASPLQASIEQLRGLPPTLIITDEFDVLHSEGEAYAHKLIDAGVPVTAVRYFGTTHDFVMLNALANTPATRGAVDQASEALKKALSD